MRAFDIFFFLFCRYQKSNLKLLKFAQFSGIFPEAHTDAVIQIANMVKIEGQDEPFIRNCFVIGDTSPVIGSDIIVSKCEEELLEVDLPMTLQIYFLNTVESSFQFCMKKSW